MSWAIWITGPPGCGKTTIARGVVSELRSQGVSVKHLELDQVRRVLTPSPTYSDEEREVVYRALALMAKLLTETGVPALIDATAHKRAWRELARSLIPIFAEVQLLCPLEVCRERERARSGSAAPPGIYDRAGQPGATVPGVDVPYEVSISPELTIDTEEVSPGAAVKEILFLARRLSRRAALAEGQALRRIRWISMSSP